MLFFDQRGAGKSQPSGSLEANTTQHLIDDITMLTDHYDIESFIFVGGSWGSCLALAYGIQHPDRVQVMVLRGIFTGAQAEIDFLDRGQFQAFFPDVWDTFVARAPQEYRTDPATYHRQRVLGNEEKAMKESAFAYAEMEGSLVTIDDRPKNFDIDTFDPNGTKIEVYYMANTCFMEDNFIYQNTSKLTMPIWLVQGRYDAVCAPANAYKLHSLLPNNKLIWTIAGHSGSDRGNYDVTKSIIEGLS